MSRAGLTREAVAFQSHRAGEPGWARDRRTAAWEAFERLPMPAVTHPEAWRRTDVSGLDLTTFVLPRPTEKPGGPLHIGTIARNTTERAGLITYVDGRPVAGALDAAWAERGVIFKDLEAAVRDHPDLVQEHLFATVAAADEHRLRALHAALWSGGTFVYVPKGMEVTLPLVTQTWL